MKRVIFIRSVLRKGRPINWYCGEAKKKCGECRPDNRQKESATRVQLKCGFIQSMAGSFHKELFLKYDAIRYCCRSDQKLYQ